MAQTQVTQDLRYKNAKLLKEALSVAGSTYMGVGRISDWDTTRPPKVLGSAKERYEFDYELLGLSSVSASNIQFMIQQNTWVSGSIYDMYRHDYDETNRSYSGASRLEGARYVVYTSSGDVFICLSNNNNSPSTSLPSSTGTTPFFSADGYQWIKAYSLTPTEVSLYQSGNFIPVITNTGTSTTVSGAVYSVVLNAGGEDYTTSPVGGINQIPYYYVPVLGDGTGAVARIQVTGTTVTSIDIVRNGQDYTYATVSFDANNAYGSVDDLDADQNKLNPEGNGLFDATVIIQPEGGFGANTNTDVSVGAIGVFGDLNYDALNKVDSTTFHQVGLLHEPSFVGGGSPSTANTVKAIAVQPVFATEDLQVGEIIEQNTVAGVNSPVARGMIVGIDKDVVIDDDTTVDVIRYVQSPEYHLDSDGKLYSFTGTNAITGVTSGGGATAITTVSGAYSLMTFISGYADSDYNVGSGDLIYLSNLQTVNRTPNQSEKVSFVIGF